MYGVWVEYAKQYSDIGLSDGWWWGILDKPIRNDCEMEMVLVRIGENGGGDDIWTTNCYRYTLTF